jgi:hypothetical protein
MSDTVYEPPGWWAWLLGRRRPETQQEEALRLIVAERDATILQLRTDNKVLESTVEVRSKEVMLLTDVIERNRRRVQAETAMAGYYEGRARTQMEGM